MQKKLNLKSEKASITLLVLISMLFFLIVVSSVGVYVKNKELAVEKEYQEIKESYEKDVGKEDEIYEKIISGNESELLASKVSIGDYVAYETTSSYSYTSETSITTESMSYGKRLTGGNGYTDTSSSTR